MSSDTHTLKQVEPAVDGDVLAEVPSTEVLMKVVADGGGDGGGGSQTPRTRMARELPSMQRSQFGRQQDSGKQNSPSFGFGTGLRFDFQRNRGKMSGDPCGAADNRKKASAYSVPGPGYYRSASSVGRQEYSEKRSYPTFAFGRADRFATDHREEKMQMASTTAPGTYPLVDSVGGAWRTSPATSSKSR